MKRILRNHHEAMAGETPIKKRASLSTCVSLRIILSRIAPFATSRVIMWYRGVRHRSSVYIFGEEAPPTRIVANQRRDVHLIVLSRAACIAIIS